MCPIGYESTPTKPQQVYATMDEISEFDDWIIIGEVSKCYPCFHVKSWREIYVDINCAFPEFFNIRKSDEGVQIKTSASFTTGKSFGGNLHCLIEFERTKLEEPSEITESKMTL